VIDELIKNARLSSIGRKLLSSQQKSFIVEDWESTCLPCEEYCRRHGLITRQVYNWRSVTKSGIIMNIKNQGGFHSKAELEMLRKVNKGLKRALEKSTIDIKF